MKAWKIGTSNTVAFSCDGRLLAALGGCLRQECSAEIEGGSLPSIVASLPCDLLPDHSPTVKSTSGQIVVIDAQSGQTAVDFKNTEDGKGSNLHYS